MLVNRSMHSVKVEKAILEILSASAGTVISLIETSAVPSDLPNAKKVHISES